MNLTGHPWRVPVGAGSRSQPTRVGRTIPSAPRTSGGGPRPGARAGESGSTFIVVLWIALGLVSLAIYFAHTMGFELKASDNRVCGLAAEQAIDGATRYLSYVLNNLETNGVMPDSTTYLSEAVPVGDAHFWLIGRDTNNAIGPGDISFGLIDEASKLNLNTASSNMLVFLPRTTLDLTEAILDWRDTNGGSGSFETYYAMQKPPYQTKCASFETIDELRLLYGSDMATLVGDDLNRNGVIDPNEYNQGRNTTELGMLEYVTAWSREPNTYSNGLPRVNIANASGVSGQLPSLLQSTLGSSRAQLVLAQLGLTGTSAPPTFRSPLQFYMRCHAQANMTEQEFERIASAITVQSGSNYIQGRVNINTASAAVLACLPGLSDTPDLAQTLVTYREQNPDKVASIAWIVEALGQNNNTVLNALAARDCITTASYQFTADIAALGPYGRGYRRVRVIFDTVDGTAKIVYRQDLTHLGWALGRQVRQTWLLAKDLR